MAQPRNLTFAAAFPDPRANFAILTDCHPKTAEHFPAADSSTPPPLDPPVSPVPSHRVRRRTVPGNSHANQGATSTGTETSESPARLDRDARLYTRVRAVLKVHQVLDSTNIHYPALPSLQVRPFVERVRSVRPWQPLSPVQRPVVPRAWDARTPGELGRRNSTALMVGALRPDWDWAASCHRTIRWL